MAAYLDVFVRAFSPPTPKADFQPCSNSVICLIVELSLLKLNISKETRLEMEVHWNFMKSSMELVRRTYAGLRIASGAHTNLELSGAATYSLRVLKLGVSVNHEITQVALSFPKRWAACPGPEQHLQEVDITVHNHCLTVYDRRIVPIDMSVMVKFKSKAR